MDKDKLIDRLKRPRGALLVLLYLLTVISAVVAVFLAVYESGDPVLDNLSYAAYALAAITLGYSVYTVVIYAPTAKRSLTAKAKKYKIVADVMENYDLKTMLFSLCSFGITVAFATMNLVNAFKYRLIWYASISAYYFVLILFRGGIMLADKKLRKKFDDDDTAYVRAKWRIYLAGGAILILLEMAMAVAVTEMLFSRRPMNRSQVMVIANAAYTFYKMTMAIYNLFKAKKFGDPVVQALRNINLADACMSMASLTVFMLATFGEGAEGLLILKAMAAFAACAVIIVMSAVMIVKAKKELKGNFNGRE